MAKKKSVQLYDGFFGFTFTLAGDTFQFNPGRKYDVAGVKAVLSIRSLEVGSALLATIEDLIRCEMS